MGRLEVRQGGMAPLARIASRSARRVEKAAPEIAPRPPPPVDTAVSLAHEVILDGCRYRLVPVEAESAAAQAGVDAPSGHLTARELQIATLVAEGRVNKQIAAELQISEWTVSTHLRRIFAKLRVDTRAAMVSKCLSALRR